MTAMRVHTSKPLVMLMLGGLQMKGATSRNQDVQNTEDIVQTAMSLLVSLHPDSEVALRNIVAKALSLLYSVAHKKFENKEYPC